MIKDSLPLLPCIQHHLLWMKTSLWCSWWWLCLLPHDLFHSLLLYKIHFLSPVTVYVKNGMFSLCLTIICRNTVKEVFWFFFFFCFSSVQFSSVAQSCPTLCDPMNRSTPGLPVHHQLPEFTQTHVHRVRDAIQPSHPLSSPSPAPNPSQHQSLFQ